MRMTVRARLLPSATSAEIRERLTVTSANSEATKKPLASTSIRTTASFKTTVENDEATTDVARETLLREFRLEVFEDGKRALLDEMSQLDTGDRPVAYLKHVEIGRLLEAGTESETQSLTGSRTDLSPVPTMF